MLNPDGGIKHQKVAGSKNSVVYNCYPTVEGCRADFSPLVNTTVLVLHHVTLMDRYVYKIQI